MNGALVAPLFAALALSAVQAPPPPRAAPPVPARSTCRMIAPNGAVLGFDMATRQQGETRQIRLALLARSPWPGAGGAYLDPTRFEGTDSAYVVGAGAGATVFTLEPFYPDHDYFVVGLSQKRGDQRGLALAQGYCSAAPSRPLVAPPRPGGEAPFTDSASWTDHCWVLGRDGRRSAIRYRQGAGGASVTLEPLDRAIWPGAAMTVPRSQPPAFHRVGIGIIFGFAMPQGPGASPSFYDIIHYEDGGGLGTISLHFYRMASSAPVGEDAGFGMCGLRGLRGLRRMDNIPAAGGEASR